MIGNSRGPRAIRAALIASAILGAVPFGFTGLAEAQTAAQSNQAGGTGSQDAGKADPPKATGKVKGKDGPCEGSRPSRSSRLLHGPADRRRHVVGRCRLAVPAGADRGRAARGDARRP